MSASKYTKSGAPLQDKPHNCLQNKNLAKPKQKAILLKIAPDLTNEQLLDIIDIIMKLKLCIIAKYDYFS
jgi:dihydroorotate dehydrogenase